MPWENLGIHGQEVEMKVFNFHKRQKKQKGDVFDDEPNGVQFNVVINKDIKAALQNMAKQFRLNQSVLTEHLLQTGLYYTAIAIKDPKKRESIEAHLIDEHLLNNYVGDEEIIIRLVEPNQNWMLLAYSKQVVAKAVRLKKALDQVHKTGDFGPAERAEKEVSRAILRFADYLVKHRFEEDDIEGD